MVNLQKKTVRTQLFSLPFSLSAPSQLILLHLPSSSAIINVTPKIWQVHNWLVNFLLRESSRPCILSRAYIEAVVVIIEL
jgi:hypothetical protein